MKFNGGRTIQCSKLGNIVYESLAMVCHVVDNEEYESADCSDDDRVKVIKFEERYRRRKNIPIKHLAEVEKLVSFLPFSFRNGLNKYTFYTFSNNQIKSLKPKKRKRVEEVLKLRYQVGMIEAYRKLNKKRTLARDLKEFEDTEVDLNKLWKRSMTNFLNGE